MPDPHPARATRPTPSTATVGSALAAVLAEEGFAKVASAYLFGIDVAAELAARRGDRFLAIVADIESEAW
jgi:hypothetical protein